MDLEKLEKMAINQNINEITKEFTPFIKNFSKKFTLIGYDQEDLYQECYLALILCLEKYQKGNNTFVAYATKSVKNHIYNLLRSQKKLINTKCIEQNLILIFSEEKTINIEDNYENKELINKLNEALLSLNLHEMHLIKHVYYKNNTLSAYCRLLNMQYSLARSKKIKILNKLREIIIFKL